MNRKIGKIHDRDLINRTQNGTAQNETKIRTHSVTPCSDVSFLIFTTHVVKISDQGMTRSLMNPQTTQISGPRSEGIQVAVGSYQDLAYR